MIVSSVSLVTYIMSIANLILLFLAKNSSGISISLLTTFLGLGRVLLSFSVGKSGLNISSVCLIYFSWTSQFLMRFCLSRLLNAATDGAANWWCSFLVFLERTISLWEIPQPEHGIHYFCNYLKCGDPLYLRQSSSYFFQLAIWIHPVFCSQTKLFLGLSSPSGKQVSDSLIVKIDATIYRDICLPIDYLFPGIHINH